jgi:2-polyprenyl-3-methyl-5-hydroxy-6-metoxy-1,4-benzoquinol methylase
MLLMNDLRNDFTHRLLIVSGINTGMRVLDVGCGTGDLSLLTAEFVGSSGEVVGFDVSESAIHEARHNILCKSLPMVHFFQSDIASLSQDIGKFDAIVGRRILMYLGNAVNSIQYLANFLKPDGIVVFQESNCLNSFLNGVSLPLHLKVQSWIWDTVSKEGGDIHIGMNLYSIMKAASLNVKCIKVEAIIHTMETGSDLAWVIKMMMDRIIRHGIATADEIGIDTLDMRLKNEMEKENTIFIRDVAFGVISSK